ncbi:MAG: RNA polymerase sigma factor [Lapillicoccus sp.]
MEEGRHRSDEQLLRAVSDRDVTALRDLYARHAPWLSVRLLRRCNDSDLVASAIQDCFTAVWDHPSRWRGDGEVSAWLWGIALRRLISGLRGRRRMLDITPRRHGLAEQSAEERVLEAVEYGDLGVALQRLAPELRAVVQATILDGLTSREAAVLLGIPTNTVKTRVHRAKAQLRELIVSGGVT